MSAVQAPVSQGEPQVDIVTRHNVADLGVATDVGPTRERNEDAALVPGLILAGADRGSWSGNVPEGPRSLVMVIDGMGGHGAGSIASALAALVINEASAELPRPGPNSLPDPEWISATLQRAGDVVTDVGALEPATRIMGAALVGLVVGALSVQVFHVGDCRCYVLDEGYFSLLTADHRSRSGALTRSIGGTGHRESIVADHSSLERDRDRRFVLCSDGLSETLDFATIHALAKEGAPLQAAQGLVEAAVRAGSLDNVTALVADVPAL